jgi:hypothetical protein
MYLIKSLQNEHRESALNEGQMRIGTINYYREIEDARRVDGEEGLGKIVWCGQKLEQDHFNKIFTPFDGIQLINGWSIENKGIPIHGAYPNFGNCILDKEWTRNHLKCDRPMPLLRSRLPPR